MKGGAAIGCLTICAAAYGFQVPAPMQAPAATPPPKGSIEGQVMSAKGGPLKKANVQLTMMNSGGGVATMPVRAPAGIGAPPLLANAPVRKAVETDEQGRFSFAGLAPGKYRLSADRQGFLRQSYGARKYSGGGTPVMVADGQSVKGIVFSLSPQAVITGKVLDEDGEPVAGLQVRALKNLYRGGKRQWSQVGNAQTSDIGEFRLPGLEPGRYLVASMPRNNVGVQLRRGQASEPLPATPDEVYASTYYPSTKDSATAVPIDVGAGGEIRGIDIRLVKTRVYRVRGRVVGGAEARNITVFLTPREAPQGQQLIAIANGENGEFEIRNVPPGQYTASAQTRGRGADAMAVAPVDVMANHVDGLVLTLTPGRDIQGSIKVVDATPPPDLKNVSVMLRPVGVMGGMPGRSKVDDELKFTIKSVPAVKYAVNVIGVPDTAYVKSIQYGGRDVTEDGIEMSSGGTLDIVLSGAAAQIDAVVVDKDGKAAWNAVVAIVPKEGSINVRTADENGILSLRGLKPGEYRLYAWEDVEPGAPQDPDFLKPFEAQSKSLKLDANGHEAVQLKAIVIE